MDRPVTRRDLLKGTSTLAASGIALNALSTAQASSKSDTVVIGLMGCKRGRELIEVFGKQSGVELRYIAETDSERGEYGAELATKNGFKRPQVVGDFRKILDDPSVDALVCAAPNHWHAPATILACAAGKHVYVEKPCSHNPREGELMLEAARKHNRAVQVGTQRRSSPTIAKAVELLKTDIIGKVHSASSSYGKGRDTMGKGELARVPAHIDFELWQGPAPRTPFKDNYLHYNWHWMWHWGNGEMGNNGVHCLDICRWGMGVDFPTRVVSSGGRFCYEDDQQTADTHFVSYEFLDNKRITWDGHSCNRFEGPFALFRGTNGSIHVGGDGSFTVYGERNKVLREEKGVFGMDEHVQNFLTAIREEKPELLNAEIEEGHKSTLLCHLGNIAHRTGRTLNCNPANGQVLNDEKAMQLWQREYEPGWEPKV